MLQPPDHRPGQPLRHHHPSAPLKPSITPTESLKGTRLETPLKPGLWGEKDKPRNHKEVGWKPVYYSSCPRLALASWLKPRLIRPHMLILTFCFHSTLCTCTKAIKHTSGMWSLFVLLPGWLPVCLEMSSLSPTG